MTATLTQPGMTVMPRRDPQRTALAAIITFVVMIIGLWAILGYMHSMAVTLSSLNAANDKLQTQLHSANGQLSGLSDKTSYVAVMAIDSGKLRDQMAGLDAGMSGMIGDVDTIATQMKTMNASIGQLDTDVGAVGTANGSVGQKLGAIAQGLQSQVKQVHGMRKDVAAAATSLVQLPPTLKATNARLTHVNSVVCYMGATGIVNSADIRISFLGIPNGTATIKATIIPPGGWTC